MLNVICCLYLASVSQKPSTSKIVKVKNGKKQFQYYYSAILLLWWHCRLLHLFFNLFYSFSLLSIRLFNSLSFLISSPSLSMNCSQLSLSLCANGWASTPVCGSWVNGLVDCSQLSFSLVEGGDGSSRWRWTLMARFCCRGSFLVMGLPPWVDFGHGSAVMGAFGSWFCRR